MIKTKLTQQTVFALCDRIYIKTGQSTQLRDLTTELACSNSAVQAFLAAWLAHQPPPRTDAREAGHGAR